VIRQVHPAFDTFNMMDLVFKIILQLMLDDMLSHAHSVTVGFLPQWE
jgi:hypothetical protein